MFKGIKQGKLKFLSIKLVIATILCAITNLAYAEFPLPPRLSANAYASNHAVAQTDLMLPLQGDNSHNLYLNPALSYASNNQGELDIGLGYRWLSNKAVIYGSYLFGGYSRIDNNARLFIVNPGVEILASRWDTHLNVYIPVGDRHYHTNSNTEAPYFSQHAELVNIFQTNQYVGYGADVKLGYQLFPRSSWKGYLGSYFFTPAQTNNIWGGAAGLEYWLDSYLKIIGSYTYDRLHRSTYALGLGVEFGGTRSHRADPSLEERLTDPVERYLSELGEGSYIPAAPMKTLSRIQVLQNNLAFFSQAGGPNNGGSGLTLANCTYENPCGPTDFSQSGVNSLNGLLPNTRMYFNGGTYDGPDNPITLNNGQSMHSRTTDYSQPETDSTPSIFDKELILNGNNTLENIILLPTTSQAVIGITINNANNKVIGVVVGQDNNGSNIGIQDNGQNTLIENSQIWVGSNNYSGVGILINGANTNTTITNSKIDTDIYNSNGKVGISITNGAKVTIVNTSINTTNHSLGVKVDNSFVDIQGSMIHMDSPSTLQSDLIGLQATNSSLIKANNTNISVAAITNGSGSSKLIGLDSQSNSRITLSNSQVSIDAGDPASLSVFEIASGNTQIINSTCKKNGILVSCT